MNLLGRDIDQRGLRIAEVREDLVLLNLGVFIKCLPMSIPGLLKVLIIDLLKGALRNRVR